MGLYIKSTYKTLTVIIYILELITSVCILLAALRVSGSQSTAVGGRDVEFSFVNKLISQNSSLSGLFAFYFQALCNFSQ